MEEILHQLIGLEIPNSHRLDVFEARTVNNGINYQPQLVGRISEPSTELWHFTESGFSSKDVLGETWHFLQYFSRDVLNVNVNVLRDVPEIFCWCHNLVNLRSTSKSCSRPNTFFCLVGDYSLILWRHHHWTHHHCNCGNCWGESPPKNPLTLPKFNIAPEMFPSQ